MKKSLSVILLASSLAACGGGGGGGGGTTMMPETPPPPRDERPGAPPPPPPVNQYGLTEAQVQNGVGTRSNWLTTRANPQGRVSLDINTDNLTNAWGDGWTGRGIDVAVIDSGSHGFTVERNLKGGTYNSHQYYGYAPEANTRRVSPFVNSGLTITDEAVTDYSNYVGDADVINISRGWGFYTNFNSDGAHIVDTQFTAPEAIAFIEGAALRDKDAVVVIAAGNDGLDCADWRACNITAGAVTGTYTTNAAGTHATGWTRNEDNNGIVVVALDHSGSRRASYSQTAGVFAEDAISVEGNDAATGGQGTSYAAPRVAGAAALVKHKFETSTAITKSILLETADSNFEGYNRNEYGHGKLDVGAAMSPIGNLR